MGRSLSDPASVSAADFACAGLSWKSCAIGNSTSGGVNTDYTFESNAGSYVSRTLYVLVKPESGLAITLR